MTTQRHDLRTAFQKLRLGSKPIIAHASLSTIGHVEGGAQTVVDALLDVYDAIIMPTFTYKTMVIPLTGPPKNGLIYGSGRNRNTMAEFFAPDMPADSLMGRIPEALRLRPRAERSNHPILSFTGINAERALDTQILSDPFAPIGELARQDGWVFLLGVNHTANTSIHYAEKLAGRRQFVRWALTPQGVQECPSWPGCSEGFQDIDPDLEEYTRRSKVGNAVVKAISLKKLFEVVMARINIDPLGLLCQRENCERCGEIRSQLAENNPTG